MKANFTLDLANESATLYFGASLAKVTAPGLNVYLHGDLGAGKTTLVRGLLNALGYQGKVKSPTYTLVEPYELPNFTLYHFDLYRFNDEEEWEAAGFRDYFNAQSVCLIEWPDKAGHILPMPDVNVHFSMKGLGRSVHVASHTALGQQCVTAMNRDMPA